MIKRLIKSIRRKPKGVRDNIAMSIAGVFTAAVFVVWLYHMPARQSVIAEKAANDSTPGFSQIFREIGTQATAIKSSLSEVSKEENEPEAQKSSLETEGDFSQGVFTSSPNTSSSSTSSSTTSSSTSSSVQSAPTIPREVRIVTTATTSTSVTATAGEQ